MTFERGDEPNQWLATVNEIPECHTFGRGLSQTRERVREALSLWIDNAEDVQLRERLPTPARMRVADIHKMRSSIERQQQELRKVTAETFSALVHHEGWSLRDVATAFDVSHQRVSQLVRSPSKSPKKRLSTQAKKKATSKKHRAKS